MMNKALSINLWHSVLLLILAFGARPGCAATVWNGPLTTFTKTNGSNSNLAASQDRLTANVWLTRGSSLGLFNVQNEGSFSHFVSPAGTQWADGTLANFATLTYQDWNTWAKGVHSGPPSTVGVNAVVHLVADDIYLSVMFNSWTSGGAGGGFSYLRSTPVPEPSAALLTLAGLAAAAGFRSRRPRVRQ